MCRHDIRVFIKHSSHLLSPLIFPFLNLSIITFDPIRTDPHRRPDPNFISTTVNFAAVNFLPNLGLNSFIGERLHRIRGTVKILYVFLTTLTHCKSSFLIS